MFIKLRIQITFTVIQTFCIIVYNKKHKERHLKLKKNYFSYVYTQTSCYEGLNVGLISVIYTV